MYTIKTLLTILVFTLANCTVQTSQSTNTTTTSSPTETNPPSATVAGDPQPTHMQGMLETHNSYRKEVGVTPLQWSNKLEQVAAEWAKELQSRGCKMQHRPNSGKWETPYGENLYWSRGRERVPSEVANNWGSEKQFFDYDKANYSNFTSNGEDVGHYTQMVWSSTTHVGCAMAKCGNIEIWVCNYEPSGNWMGRKPY